MFQVLVAVGLACGYVSGGVVGYYFELDGCICWLSGYCGFVDVFVFGGRGDVYPSFSVDARIG